MKQSLRRPLALLLSLLLAFMPMLSAQAAIISNEQIFDQAPSGQTQDSLQQLLGQTSVQQQLQAWGVSPEQAKSRIDALTESELARITRDIDHLQAGGDSILGVLLVIFIVFVITDVIGATDIFPFIHPVR